MVLIQLQVHYPKTRVLIEQIKKRPLEIQDRPVYIIQHCSFDGYQMISHFPFGREILQAAVRDPMVVYRTLNDCTYIALSSVTPVSSSVDRTT